jgi:hypothetical protein
MPIVLSQGRSGASLPGIVLPGNTLVSNQVPKVGDYSQVMAKYNPQSYTEVVRPLPINLFYAWYDASEVSSIITNPSDQVTQWSDKSGNNNHLTISTTTFPKYNMSTQKGLKVVDFPVQGNNIGSNFMNVPGVSQSWFVVCKINATFGNAASILSYMTRNPDNGLSSWEMYNYDNDCFIGALGRSVPAPGALILEYGKARINGGTCIDNNYHMFEVVFNREALTTSIYLDGTLKDSKPDALPWNQITGARFKIFANRASSQFCTGSVAEVICMSGASDINRETVERYLTQKWL